MLAESGYKMGRAGQCSQEQSALRVETDGTLRHLKNQDTNPTENEIGRRCRVNIMEENKASLATQQVKIPHLTLSSHTQKE